MVAVLLLLRLELVCLGLLALLRFRAAGSVLMDVQLQRLLVVLGVALTHGAPGLPSTAYALPQPSQDPHRTVASEQSPRTQGQGSTESAAHGQSAAINGI